MSSWKYKGNSTKPNNHVWDEYVDEETGESTLEIHTPKKISNFDTCEHYYEVEKNGHSVRCKNCGLGHTIVWGIQIVKDGKIVNAR